jgi:hypothetical protein
MDWKPATKNEQGLLKVPKRWLHLHYYEALNILFRFENSLRVFVYTVLKNEFADSWSNCSFSVPGGESASIKSIAAKRIGQADSFGYLGFDTKAPLMHLTSGELVELIMADAYWPKFRSHFKGNKEIIKNKLLEVGTIRNSLAHFRPMKAEDIEVVKQNARHTLLSVEECLSNIFSQTLRVPTNTSDQWYKSISTLGTKYIKTTPYYSANESWVNVKLVFDAPILSKSAYTRSFHAFTLAKVNSPNLLLNHPTIKSHVTYLSEAVNYPTLDENLDISISKDLNLVFRKDVLVANVNNLVTELSDALSKITEECELLLQDNLARGTLVEPASVHTWWRDPQQGKDGRWVHVYDELRRPYQSSDPDEYWGQHEFASDAVAGLCRYPWMPQDISEAESFLD